MYSKKCILFNCRNQYRSNYYIGIAETVRLIFNNEQWLANGPRGFAGMPQPLSGLVEARHYNYIYLLIVILILVLLYLLTERAIRSP